MTLVTRTFQPSTGAKIHIVHETRTAKVSGYYMVAMCGKQFQNRVVGLWQHKKATCPTCLKLDNPFELTQGQTIKFWRMAQGKGNDPRADDLMKRDLIKDEDAGGLTPRGEVLARDLQFHPPWPDINGVVHGRNAIAWRRAICGMDLMGLDKMSFAMLDKTLVVNKDLKVTCMECMLEVP